MYKIFVMEDPELGNQSPYVELISVGDATDESVALIVKRIASHYRSYNARFTEEKERDVFSLNVTATFIIGHGSSKHYFEFCQYDFQQLMNTIEQSIFKCEEIKTVKELLSMRDKMEVMRNEVTNKAADFRHWIFTELRKTDVYFSK